MNNAPTVFVPTEPESNGLTLPMLLSLLAHGIVFGLLIYTYQQPTLEPAGAIETTMVSPEQLAELQGQVMANRAAAAEAASSAGSVSATESFESATSSESANSNDSSDYSQPSSQRVPVFMRSDEPSSRPMLMSEEQKQRLLDQSEEYERNLAEWNQQQDNSANQRLEQVDERKQEEIEEERKRLREFRAAQNKTPRVNRPSSTTRNIEIETGSSGNSNSTGKTFSLSDGDSTASSSASNNRSAAGGSRGASNSEILSRIKRNYSPPTAAKGSTQRATLTITVNSSGDVTNVSVSGSDSAVNEAAKQAVLNTGNLPIDASDPKYPTFTVQFNGSN